MTSDIHTTGQARAQESSGTCEDQTALELLFEHGYSVRDVLRCLHRRVRRLEADEAPAVAHSLQAACSALGRLCAAHPADARDLGL